MAQVIRSARAVVFASALLIGVSSAAAQTSAQAPLPPGAVAAEAAGRWEEALGAYRQLLQADPSRVDVAIRIADIQARMGRTAEAAATLAAAVRHAPSDAALLARTSQAYATANYPKPALEMMLRALELRPRDVEFLRAAGQLSSWNGDYDAAIGHYRALLEAQPQDADARLQLARNLSWTGDTNASAGAYRVALQQQPATATAWLELANVESWRGNYPGALEALGQYESRFGTAAPEYSVTLARVLAGAGRPSRAVALLDPLAAQQPRNYDVTAARTVALTMKRSVGEARESLAALRALDANNKQTRDTARLVRARLGSRIEPGFTFYSDSDRLRTIGITPAATLIFPSGTEVSGGWSRFILDGERANGLGASDGGSLTHEETWVGLAQALGPLTVAARAASPKDKRDLLTPYAASVAVRLGDAFTLSLNRSESFVLISPKTVELSLTELRHRATIEWTPTLRTTIAADASVQDFSDGNRRIEMRLSPRQAVVRRSRLNLDLGVEAYRLEADADLPNGYYDPRLYEAYQAVAYPYFKLGENVGAGLVLALGGQRERGQRFELGGSASGELTVGIYQAWVLRMSAGALHNLRQESGAFRGYSGALSISRRF